jgi:hypothetical protein
MTGYQVGQPHPSMHRKALKPGDLVMSTVGWPGRMAVFDIDHASGIAELTTQTGTRIRARIADLTLVPDSRP